MTKNLPIRDPQPQELRDDEITSSKFSDSLALNGSLLVRSLFKKPTIDESLAYVMDHYSFIDSLDETEKSNRKYFMETFRGAALLKNVVSDTGKLIDSALVKSFLDSKTLIAIRDYFGEPVGVLGWSSRTRRVGSELPKFDLPFHQDSFVFKTNRALTIWIPLVDAGFDAAGLALYLEAITKDFEHTLEPSGGKYAEIEIAKTNLEFDEKLIWTPEVKAGDVIIFPPTTLHRTNRPESVCKTRYSCEFRIVPESLANTERYKGMYERLE